MTINPNIQQVGFTSDYHLFHRNIIKYSNRPFSNVLEMNEAIRDRHNATFDKDAVVFNLGDALLLPRERGKKHPSDEDIRLAESLLSTFKGRIHYLPGNHESSLDLIRARWKIMPQLYEVHFEDNDAENGRQSIVLCHYALRTWNKAHHSSWHLYGHSHGGLMNDNREMMQDYPYTLSMDVGVDSNDFYPFLYQDIKAHMATKTFRPTDHHSGRMGGFGGEDLSK
jgi:calcineurin-like phosphoesterase family protein